MRKYFFSLWLCLMLFPVLSVEAGEWTGNINWSLGIKAMSESDWGPEHEHDTFGINFDFRKTQWPVNIIIGMISSSSAGTDAIFSSNDDFELKTTEYRLGLRKIWEPNATMRPFIGGGFGLISTEVEWQSYSRSDIGLGGWLSGGVYWTLMEQVNMGCDIGYSYAEVDISGSKGNAGGVHAAVMFGFNW